MTTANKKIQITSWPEPKLISLDLPLLNEKGIWPDRKHLTASQERRLTEGVYVMTRLAITILVAASVVTAAHAQQQQQQQRSARDMMNDMKARYGQTFDQCRDLAVSRGYRLDEEAVDRAVMMFIEGCIMGKQR